MKIFRRMSVLGVPLAIAVCTFVVAPQLRADNNASATNPVVLSSTNGAASVSAVGSNWRVWSPPVNTNSFILSASNRLARLTTNSHPVVELATGLNYWDGQQWSPSVASFQTSTNGFAATQTQHKVYLAANLNQVGAVLAVTPEGTNLYSSPVAIALYDAASGSLAVVGNITNCYGTMVNSNKIVYQNAFSGICADIVYTMERGAFHQDVVLTGQLNPADYGYPTNTTRIQIITELYNPPTPDRLVHPLRVEQDQTLRSQMATPDLVDEILGFGHFTFGVGKAYLTPKNSTNDSGALVAKRLFNVNGRMLLVESVDYKSIWRGMATLPVCSAGPTNSPGGTSGGLGGIMRKTGNGNEVYAAIPVPPKGGPSTAAKPVLAPKNGIASVSRAGLVIDYTVDTGSMTDTSLFQSDTTYFVSGALYCDGPTTIEGGAVFKYPLATGDYSSGAFIRMGNALTLATSSYRPAIFTAADDDSVGTKLNTVYTGYDGNPGAHYNSGTGYGWPYLNLSSSYGWSDSLSHLNFFYAQEAIYTDGNCNPSLTVSHAQFVHCVQGIELGNGSGTYITLNNCLIHDVQHVLTDDSPDSDIFYFYNCTLHQTSNTMVIMTSDPYPNVYCYNSIFIDVSNGPTAFTGDHNGFFNSPDTGTSCYDAVNYPFATALSGGHYLTSASGFWGAGTTNIDSGLLADLRTMTTRAPPVNLSNTTFEISMLMYPQVPRDTNPATVDLGYHYDPIDFLVDNITVSNNCTLTLTSGVVVATYGSLGINLADNAILQSVGTPLTHNFLTQTRAVQESPDAWAAATIYTALNPTEATLFVYLRFTDVTFLPKAYNNLMTGTVPIQLLVQDSRLSGAGFLYEVDPEDVNMPQMELHNNVLERCYLDVADASEDGTYVSAGVDWFNNLFFGGKVLAYHFTGTWSVRDNIFDSVTILDGSSSAISRSHNAYVNMTTAFTGTETSPHTLSSFTYLAGPLGPYYQPSGSALLNVGSRAANLAGLYHYTVGTNEMKETTSTVTIGPHYVALNSYGQPDNYSGDGIPDYLKDSNGDGSYGTGDLGNWLASSSSGGVSGWLLYLEGRNLNVSSAPSADTTGITHLKVYTPLK